MFFRFTASLILVVLISMIGIGLEKRSLKLKRAVSRQYYQQDVLLELHARQLLNPQPLTAPVEVSGQEPAARTADVSAGSAGTEGRPMMRWNNPGTFRQ